MARRSRKSSPGPYLLDVKLVPERMGPADQFPYCLPVVRFLEILKFHPKVTFLVGENGTGKSTLLEAIAVSCGLNPEGGSRNFNFATRASHSCLDACLRVAKSFALPADSYFLRAESFYNVATEIERLDAAPGGSLIIDAYGGVSLHDQSHGESFFALVEKRLRPHGLYIMDEPEAAVSPKRQLQFLAWMHHYCNHGCQFVIATHSPVIMAYPQAWIYVLGDDGIRKVPYAETEHYQISRGFLSNPEKALAALLDNRDRNEPDA